MADPSAMVVFLYSGVQATFAWRAWRRRARSGNALAWGFTFAVLWHASHFCARSFKEPWTWFGSHYFYPLCSWQFAKSLGSPRTSVTAVATWAVLDVIVGCMLGDFFGLVSGVSFGAFMLSA